MATILVNYKEFKGPANLPASLFCYVTLIQIPGLLLVFSALTPTLKDNS